MPESEQRPVVSRVSHINGAIGGAVAFSLGYIITYLAGMSEIQANLSGSGETVVNFLPLWKIIGWVFYKGHNVPVEFSAGGMGMSLSQMAGIAGGEASFPVAIFVLPVVILLISGAVVVFLSHYRTLKQSIVGGASITSGYFVLTVVVGYLININAELLGVNLSAGPNLVIAALVMGIIYPAVMGGIGGVLAYGISSS